MYKILVVKAASCDPATQCEFDASLIDPHVNCTSAPHGNTVDPCYGTWSSFTGCACDTNYRISSTGVTYWCYSGGSWSPDIYSLKCYAPCVPDAKDPAIASANPVLDGEYVVYSCPTGYSELGDKQVTCTDGVWEIHAIFECLAPCNFPNSSIPTDETVTEPVAHGTSVSFTCIDGYIPTDTWVSSCEDGSFDTDVVCTIEQCASDQCELDDELFQDRVVYSTPTRYGNSAPPVYCYGEWSYIESFSCTGDKWVVRPVTTTTYCVEDGNSNFNWDHDIYNLTCHEPCTVLSGIPGDVVTKDHEGKTTSLFEHEQYVTYDCADSTATLLGVKTATCTDGKWDNEAIPECFDACNFPQNAHSTRGKTEPVAHGDTVILQCDDGYEPRDTETSQCQDGTLSPTLTCTVSV